MISTTVPNLRRGREVDCVITALAARACSTVHARDLRAAGVSRDMVRRRVASGLMTRALPLTYYVGPSGTCPDLAMRCSAGVLCAGPGSFVSGGAAATLVAGWDRGGEVITVGVGRPGGRAPARADGYTFHRMVASREAVALSPARGVPVLRALENTLELARQGHTPLQVAFLIRRFVHLGLLDFDALLGFVEQQACARGIGVLRQAVRLVVAGSSGTKSRTEDRLHDGLDDAGEAPHLVNLRGCMGIVGDEPDFVWLDAAVNVEVDGGHHDLLDKPAQDDERDRVATARGWLVLRFHWRDVWRDRDGIVGHIRDVLADRRARRPRAGWVTG